MIWKCIWKFKKLWFETQKLLHWHRFQLFKISFPSKFLSKTIKTDFIFRPLSCQLLETDLDRMTNGWCCGQLVVHLNFKDFLAFKKVRGLHIREEISGQTKAEKNALRNLHSKFHNTRMSTHKKNKFSFSKSFFHFSP